jgi:hypothetical protein
MFWNVNQPASLDSLIIPAHPSPLESWNGLYRKLTVQKNDRINGRVNSIDNIYIQLLTNRIISR